MIAKRSWALAGGLVLFWAVQWACGAAAARGGGCSIVRPPGAGFREALAAREIRRYAYLRTGRLLPILPADEPPGRGDVIVVARKDRPLARALAAGAEEAVAALGPEQYLLKTVRPGGRKALLVIGGDAAGALYGAYRLAEYLGVRFYLHGDTVPDRQIPFRLPALDEVGTPIFESRGVQPWHDFPEGPDWWNLDHYKSVLSQLAKLRMNYLGLHCYPQGRGRKLVEEPTVWVGLPEDLADDGNVRFAYTTSYQNTLRGNWGYSATKTGDFLFGASELFERDAYGADVMEGLTPRPKDPDGRQRMFNRTAAMLGEAFRHARRVGVRVCPGTEVPVIVHSELKERLKAKGKDPSDPSVLRELYEGMFGWLARNCPTDVHVLWLPEHPVLFDWKQALRDISLARAAARKAAPGTKFAVCSWGWLPGRFRQLDQALPPDVAVGCLNYNVGKSPVDARFRAITGRRKWAGPWLEDDAALTSLQLWVGRMRRDAADARRFGCTGVMGTMWRTRIIGPNVSALAKAAWDRGGKDRDGLPDGPDGGLVARFRKPIAGTEDDPLYQSVRYHLAGYVLAVPNGTYTVTLKFCEPAHRTAGKRVFDVTCQGTKVIEKLDIFATVGPNRALDYTFKDVRVTAGRLKIGLVHVVEYPCIAAISVEKQGYGRKINCGGPKYKDYAADTAAGRSRSLPADEFYRDWALHQFGREAGKAAAEIFARIDGRVPVTSRWGPGPGQLRTDRRPWDQARKDFRFVRDFADLRPKVRGAGNLARFDYWLNTFRYMRAQGRTGCLWARFGDAAKAARDENDTDARKRLIEQSVLPLHRQMVQAVEEVHTHLLATVSTPGELGTVANWAQHILPGILINKARWIEGELGRPLPASAGPRRPYRGPARLIVPTLRSGVAPGEAVTLKVIVLAEERPTRAELYWRGMGAGAYDAEPLRHVGRGVYSAKLPAEAARGTGVEYYIEAVFPHAGTLRFPPTAPRLNQTLVVFPPAEGTAGKRHSRPTVRPPGRSGRLGGTGPGSNEGNNWIRSAGPRAGAPPEP